MALVFLELVNQLVFDAVLAHQMRTLFHVDWHIPVVVNLQTPWTIKDPTELPIIALHYYRFLIAL